MALMLDNFDETPPIAIIGGGLAGCAAGAVLAQNGWGPNIFERDTFPRDKMCGEFLSGESGRLLEKIGCLSELLRHNPPRITRVRFISNRGREAIANLPEPAFGMSRKLLDETLFRHACSLGANGFAGWETQTIGQNDDDGTYQFQVSKRDRDGKATSRLVNPKLTIAAYGRRTKLDRNLQRDFLNHLDSSVGLKMHHRPVPGDAGRNAMAELSGTTEIYGLDGGYCGVSPIEGNRVNVCMLLKREAFSKVGSARREDITAYLKSENSLLSERMNGLESIDDSVLTVTQMPFAPKEPTMGDLFFIGDAAGMIAPLCGDGQAMALESGIMLAELVVSRFLQPDALFPPGATQREFQQLWERQWNHRFKRRVRAGRILQRILLNPKFAGVAMTVLQKSPQSVMDYLARITRS